MIQQHEQQQDPLQPFYDHPDSELLRVGIKESKLAGSGMGLFAKTDIQNGQHVAEYYGSVTRTPNSFDREFWYEDKMVQVDETYCVMSRAPCSRANDIVRWEPEKYNTTFYNYYRKSKSFPSHQGTSHNARIKIMTKQKAFLTVTRKIFKGEEIYIDYGFQYWDFFYRLNQQYKEKLIDLL